ncbi:MAG: prolipoprotein diacylglyceryl transferase [Oscillospiraceae bacterium]|nr:prolipoprotein diacylglyceryl transferase [Oscillospiraceae bacterium]
MTYLVASGTVFGRLGCYFNGCCYGIVLSLGARFPSQLAETGFAIIILLLFLIVRLERKKTNIMFPLFVILYSIGRLAFEFFREDTVRVGLISMSQWVAVMLIVGCIVWIVKVLSKSEAKEVRKDFN